MLTPTFRLEPGDGTGCSIADGHARNQYGICASFECGNQLPENAAEYVIGKVCKWCSQELEAIIADVLSSSSLSGDRLMLHRLKRRVIG